jgi:hypothetical protein
MDSQREVEFRDGKRWIPAYLADMMATFKTHTMTYEEAVEKANWKLAADYTNAAADRVIQGHFRGGR